MIAQISFFSPLANFFFLRLSSLRPRAAGRSPFFAKMAEIAANIVSVLRKEVVEDRTLVPYLLAVVAAHVGIQHILPRMSPRAFTFLGLKDNITDPKKLAVDARTKVIAIIFSFHVAALALWGLLGGHMGSAVTVGQLEADPYAVTPLTYHILRCASAYFIWDIYVCFTDKYPLIWWVHAICCFCVFTVALVSYGFFAVVSEVCGDSQPKQLLFSLARSRLRVSPRSAAFAAFSPRPPFLLSSFYSSFFLLDSTPSSTTWPS
jgi:hypothetical protein